MGMGFLRLNKMLAKHKWRRKDTNEEETQEGRESSFSLWLVAMALLILSVLIFGIWHTSQFF